MHFLLRLVQSLQRWRLRARGLPWSRHRFLGLGTFPIGLLLVLELTPFRAGPVVVREDLELEMEVAELPCCGSQVPIEESVQTARAPSARSTTPEADWKVRPTWSELHEFRLRLRPLACTCPGCWYTPHGNDVLSRLLWR